MCWKDGRRFRILTVVDDFTRACLAMEIDTSIGGRRVVEVLQRLVETRGKPVRCSCTTDRSSLAGRLTPGRTRRAFGIEPGKPNQNADIESFNGRLRDECRNEH